MRRIFAWLAIGCCLLMWFGAGWAQTRTQTVTAEIRKQTIDDLSALLPERYAYKELGPKLRDLLRQNLKTGKYDSISSPEEFSQTITNDLRSLNADRHLALNYDPQTQTNVSPNNPASVTPEERAKRASQFNRQMNYGFQGVQFFNGNVGYVKFNYFDSYLDYSGPIVDAAMAFLKNCDAIIIDLRDNGGGSSQMVGYIEGFFFAERTLLGKSYDRLTDTTSEGFINAQPKEKQIAAADLYLLTSKSTVSAGEALAYDLKFLKQARVIGEISAGAANPGRVTRLNQFFTAFIPNRHGTNVVSGTNWEGTGVPLDISCPAEDALRVARLEALKKLQTRTNDSAQRKRYASYITYLEKTHPEKHVPAVVLRQYVGQYQGGRTITFREGQLYYQRVAEAGGQMHFIARDVFMLADGDVTITFSRDGQNRVKDLTSRWSLNNTPAVARKIN